MLGKLRMCRIRLKAVVNLSFPHDEQCWIVVLTAGGRTGRLRHLRWRIALVATGTTTTDGNMHQLETAGMWRHEQADDYCQRCQLFAHPVHYFSPDMIPWTM